MSDFATQLVRSPPLGLIVAGSIWPDAIENVPTGESATYPATNRALYYPFLVDLPCTATQMFTYNGTAVAGKVDVGIYDEVWKRLVNIGLTTQAGTSTLQLFNITDLALAPGFRYYMALTCTSTTATFLRGTAAALRQQAGGVQQQNLGAELALPETATPANPVSAYIPLFGISFNAAGIV